MLGIRQQRIVSIDFSPRDGPSDGVLRHERPAAHGRPGRQALAEHFALRQLRPGPEQGRDRAGGGRQCRPGPAAVHRHPVRSRHQGRLRLDRRDRSRRSRSSGRSASSSTACSPSAASSATRAWSSIVFGEVVPSVRVLAGPDAAQRPGDPDQHRLCAGQPADRRSQRLRHAHHRVGYAACRADADRHRRLQRRFLRQHTQHAEHPCLDAASISARAIARRSTRRRLSSAPPCRTSSTTTTGPA